MALCPNHCPLHHVQVTTADVIPPNFTASTPLVSKVDETDFTLTVQLNKSSCTVFYTVMLYSTAQPSLASVLAGTASGSLYNGTILAGTVRVAHSMLPVVPQCDWVSCFCVCLVIKKSRDKRQHHNITRLHVSCFYIMFKLSQHHRTRLLLYSSLASRADASFACPTSSMLLLNRPKVIVASRQFLPLD